jgi:hypothetical protein
MDIYIYTCIRGSTVKIYIENDGCIGTHVRYTHSFRLLGVQGETSGPHTGIHW